MSGACGVCVCVWSSDSADLAADVAVKFFLLAEALYYRLLEAIVDMEKRILGDGDLSVGSVGAAGPDP